MRVTVDGALSKGVSAKDLALAIIAELGFGGGTGGVLEYAGDAIRAASRSRNAVSPNKASPTIAASTSGRRATASASTSWPFQCEIRPNSPTSVRSRPAASPRPIDDRSAAVSSAAAAS